MTLFVNFNKIIIISVSFSQLSYISQMQAGPEGLPPALVKK